MLNTTRWLGSVWDVFQYFEKRTSILKSFTGINSERFPLAYYILVDHEFRGYAAADKEEIGTRFQLRMLDNLGKYSDRDSYSTYVNSIVHELHTRHPEMASFVPEEFIKDVQPLDQRSAYLEMAAMLNGLPSSNRAYLGGQSHAMLSGLRGTGKCGCFAHKRLYGKRVFVSCGFSGISRTDRIRHMNRLVQAALLKYCVDEALGIAFDADSESEGYDLRWVRETPAATPDLERLAKAVLEEVSKLPSRTLSEKPDHILPLKTETHKPSRVGLNRGRT
jgi:hypothetical protein